MHDMCALLLQMKIDTLLF